MSGFVPNGPHLRFEAPGGRALFTTRAGGVSEGPYASLNLGTNTDDDPARVAENVRLATAIAGLDRLGFGPQVHGTDVVGVLDDGPADGRVSTDPGVGAMVRTADCLPVALLGDGAAAAVHAGWKGLAGGVLERGVEALRAAGATAVTAAIGPGAGPCCYEVGPEVFAAFGLPEEKANIDLKHIAGERLRAAGVATVEDCGLCTICDARFFSHRRDAGVTGRQAGIAWPS